MSLKLSQERIGDIAVLRLTNPPRNFLGPIVRAELAALLEELERDTAVRGIMLTGSGGLFSAGYNVASPEMRDGAPSLADLCDRIDGFPKPVVATLFGAVTGAGLELALAAHARLALKDTRIGLPEISVGLIPSAGGTQRLPRLIGADRALAVMLSGQVVPVSHPRLAGLVDELHGDGVEKAGLAYLHRLIKGQLPLRRSSQVPDGFADPVAYQTSVRDCRAALGETAPLPERLLVDCVERALLLPFSAGQAFEETAFQDCVASDYARGLLHVQLARRRAPNMPEAISAKPQEVTHLGVIGGGAAAAAMVQGALEGGLTVTWYERTPEAAEAARTRLVALLRTANVQATGQPAQLAHLNQTTELRDLAETDLVIEAVADNLQTKVQVFSALETVLPASVMMVCHTQTLPIDPIARASGRERQVVGLYCPPATPQTRLAELIPGPHSAPTTVVTVADVLMRMGVLPVRCGSGGGTIGMRLLCALRDAALFVADQGVSPAYVDHALVRMGMGSPVFATMDGQGLELVQKRAAQLHDHARFALHHLERVKALLAQGRTGRTAGQGFLTWQDGAVHADSATTAPLSAETIAHLCLGALINEGAKLLREDVALRPSDIDLVAIRHLGFPAWQGGPMHMADRVGLFNVIRAMKPYESTAPHLFAPDPGIARLVLNGEGFDVLNAIGRGRRKIDDPV
ncbi:3-hydroxyacyl-CoA dehydrogenase [Thalassovita litoralis]|uniref:3-hydroxyacyl-CoA dehydrogenase n=1 Tax=Thalassovita litoralis TaxID=1010611 RepID=A0A521ELG3_9RHOB|nr:enoyl-CoA hydratase-related protein [Thalassovita litoralis]SMO84754.1 3-hydroxyacyl-CoA dehydrogenase [Thalassovita litoralis]